MKLFRVYLSGMTSSLLSTSWGLSYVVASDPTEAYQIVKNYLDKRGLGFPCDRILRSVELVAETGDYPENRVPLFLSRLEFGE